MTTIALSKDLVMASDSQMTLGDMKYPQKIDKIYHTGGYTVGFCGSASQGIAFVSALEEMVERKRVQSATYLEIPQGLICEDELENFNALLVTPDNEVLLFEGSRMSFVVQAPFAIGSGAPYALTALELGHSAEEAVEVAIKFDVGSGGEVQVIDHKGKSSESESGGLTREAFNKMTKKQIEKLLFGEEN